MLRRGEFQRLAGCAPEFHGDVDPRGVDDDLGGGLPGQPALVGDRQRRTERERACASHRRETPVCTETPDDAVNGIGGARLPLARRFRDHGDHQAPGKGALQNSSPSPPSPPSPPLAAPGPPPPPDLAAMTSSIRSTMTAASVAEEMAWLPTRIGSITFSFFMSETLPLKTLIPANLFPFLCCWRSSIRMSIGSRPAFSARVRGMTSTASANASMAICSRPPTVEAKSRKARAISIALEPPPLMTLPSSIATATTLVASSRDRSSSSTTCSVPPRRRIETAFGFLHPVTKVISSSPIFFSYTCFAKPRSSFDSSSSFVTTLPPVALASFSISDFLTRRTA